MLAVLMLLLVAEAPALQRFKLNPIEYVDQNLSETLVEGFTCVESDGQHLFLGVKNSPYVLELDGKGAFIRAIGGVGKGPGKLGTAGVAALSVSAGGLWVVPSDRSSIRYYERGEALFKIPLRSYPMISDNTNVFAVSQDQVVMAAHPRSKHLALAYNYDGKVEQPVGDILPINREDLDYNPALNDTSWLFHGDKWYCLFKYRPFLWVFDKQLKLEQQFELEGPEISVMEKNFYERAPKIFQIGSQFYPRRFFFDFKAFGDHLFFICRAVLYQVNRHDGRVVSRLAFYGEGKGFEKVGSDSNLFMRNFTFLDTGQLILSSRTDLWGNELWTVGKRFKR